jgi:hypothetical protein
MGHDPTYPSAYADGSSYVALRAIEVALFHLGPKAR